MSRRAAQSPAGRRGFTLVELVMVIVIIAMIAAMAAPRFASATERYRVQLAAARLQADLRYARERAIATGQTLTVKVDPSTGIYTLSATADPDHLLPQFTVDLSAAPYSIKIAAADFGGSGKLIYNGFGVPAAGGTIRLSGGAGDITVTVEAGTGAVSVNKLGDSSKVEAGAGK